MLNTEFLEHVLNGTGFDPSSKCIYVAVPVSSGLRMWDFAARHGFARLEDAREKRFNDYLETVLHPNTDDAAKAVEAVQRRHPDDFVINPAIVTMEGWSQNQYREAWKTFIERFAAKLVSTNGWQYSHGCVEEVIHAIKNNIPIYNINDERLTVDDILDSLNRAITVSNEKHIEAPYLLSAVAELGRKHNDVDPAYEKRIIR